MSRVAWYAAILPAAVMAAGSLLGCNDSSEEAPPPPPPVVNQNCPTSTPISLDPGAHVVVDPSATSGCIRLPAAGSSGAEYLVFAFGSTGQATDAGVLAPYELSAGNGGTASATMSLAARSRVELLPPKQRFHNMLRRRARALAGQPRLFAVPPRRVDASSAAPPVVGSQRTFQVCSDVECSGFTPVTGTVVHIGPHSLVYIDNTVPTGGYAQSDLDWIGRLFDNFAYPIDTTAFGRETDLDGNGAVVILLSPAVNHLSASCNSTGALTVGFFLPDDLVPSQPGSNAGEIFYGIVPDPSNATCTISHDFTLAALGPTMMHEFQHLINFANHYVLAGAQPEDDWLDEGLSRFAEELGGRLVPDSLCTTYGCASEFVSPDVNNAYLYLQKDSLETNALVENIGGTFVQNGAAWLFVRWLADQFATDSILGTSLTRKLEGADSPNGNPLFGEDNVHAATGVDFATLISEWQSANYLQSISTFSDPAGRLRYRSWNFAQTFVYNYGFFPLVPDSTTSGKYLHDGVLLQGSGRHLRVIQPANAAEVVVALTGPDNAGLDPQVAGRVGITRVR